jgi:hypothetical protein
MNRKKILRRSYLSIFVAILGIVSLEPKIEEQLSQERKKPHNWEELGYEDKENIRRYLRRRQQEASSEELRHDLSNLVGLATMKVEGALSTADIGEFSGTKTRPTRVLPQFLIFTGSEAPRCPKCYNREYEPTETYPDKMRCQECSLLFTNQELAAMVSPGM